MPQRVLITTTIRVPFNLRDWRAAGFDDDDVFIVAGDEKTPHNEVRAFLKTLPGDNVYLAPEQQELWKCSSIIGWSSIQRRNIALLEAMKLRPSSFILTVDDDNYPIDNGHVALLEDYFTGINDDVVTVASGSGWYNVCEQLQPQCVHRGYPLSKRHDEENTIEYRRNGTRIGVIASLWLGDPDVDSVQRMNGLIHVDGYTGQSIALERGTWCPFNSQATAYIPELAPLMAVWPHVGRYDDIWASYLARAVMDAGDYRVLYGNPLVRQLRNKHDALLDLLSELHGLVHTEKLCENLRSMIDPSLENIVAQMEQWKFVPSQTWNFFEAWLEDIRMVQEV